jgi:hypothetical protein
MRSRPEFDRAVTDIQALLDGTGPDTGEPDGARLARIRQAVTAQQQTPGRRRPWWPRRPQRRHRRLVITCVALPVVLGATAAGWAVAAGSSPAIRGIVLCAGSVRLHAHGWAVRSEGLSPATLCGRAWASGKLTDGHPVRPVPRLAACAKIGSQNPDYVGGGGVIVYPDTTCAAMHLSPVPAGYDQAVRLMARLEHYLGAGSRAHCLSVPEADAYARGAVARFDLTGWVVTNPWGTGAPAGFAPQGCWEAQPDGAAHAVQVLPIPGTSPPTPKAAVGPLKVMGRVLSVPRASCRPGDPPQRAAAVARTLRAALRRAGYGHWGVLVSKATSGRLPCYRMNWYSVSRRQVYITATLYVPAPTPIKARTKGH